MIFFHFNFSQTKRFNFGCFSAMHRKLSMITLANLPCRPTAFARDSFNSSDDDSVASLLCRLTSFARFFNSSDRRWRRSSFTSIPHKPSVSILAASSSYAQEAASLPFADSFTTSDCQTVIFPSFLDRNWTCWQLTGYLGVCINSYTVSRPFCAHSKNIPQTYLEQTGTDMSDSNCFCKVRPAYHVLASTNAFSATSSMCNPYKTHF